MTINSSMQTGVSGLMANSAALGAISTNIANVNTIGYKRQAVNFEDFIAGDGASLTSATTVLPNLHQFISESGGVQATTSSTDVVINGAGLFVTTKTPTATATDARLFTRAGSFTPDADGYLRNDAGLYLQGWKVGQAHNPTDMTQLVPIQLSGTGDAQPTTKVGVFANLDSAAAAGDTLDIPVTVYDTLGTAQTMTVEMTKGATTDSWTANVYADAAKTVSVGSFPVTFDATGQPTSTTPLSVNLDYSAGGASNAQPVSIDLSGLTQFSSTSAVSSTTSDGTAFGQLSGVSIDKDGYVTASYNNGGVKKLYQLALATFPNPDGLLPTTGNAYLISNQSGTQALNTAGSGGAGTLSSQALETSTVDLSTEFTNMITTQRAYSACSKIITTADQMLQELVNIVR